VPSDDAWPDGRWLGEDKPVNEVGAHGKYPAPVPPNFDRITEAAQHGDTAQVRLELEAYQRWLDRHGYLGHPVVRL
jgi:hypothetical protein